MDMRWHKNKSIVDENMLRHPLMQKLEKSLTRSMKGLHVSHVVLDLAWQLVGLTHLVM